MKIKKLTAEEQEELRKSGHVLDVTEKSVRFSPEFKKLAWSELQKGRRMRDIFSENGIDVEILGMTRVYGFTNTLRKKAAKDKSFGDARNGNGRASKSPKEMEIDDWRDCMDEKVAYLEQELEFLKKNLEAYTEAKVIWESKLGRR